MIKWMVRIGLGLAATLAILVGVGYLASAEWKTEVARKIESDPKRRVTSTALGNIEYAIISEGIPVLVLHGSYGGYDQALIGHNTPHGFSSGIQTIAVSRPGYLGTPLSSGETAEAQADLFAALLDELEIDRVVIIAVSSGGRAGVQFALRHPNRTLGLVLRSTGVRTSNGGAPTELSDIALAVGDIMWWTAQQLPTLWLHDYDSSDPLQNARMKETVRTFVPQRNRWIGTSNDNIQSTLPAVDNWPLESISVPTLIVHGDEDGLAPYATAQQNEERIPGARLVTIRGGGHFMNITRHSEVSMHVMKFIRSL